MIDNEIAERMNFEIKDCLNSFLCRLITNEDFFKTKITDSLNHLLDKYKAEGLINKNISVNNTSINETIAIYDLCFDNKPIEVMEDDSTYTYFYRDGTKINKLFEVPRDEIIYDDMCEIILRIPEWRDK